MKLGNVNAEINGMWQVCHDSGELASAVTSYDITGLDGDTDIEYQLICRFIDDTTVGDYKLTFNIDTSANYGYQDIKGISSTASAVRDTSESYWHIGQTSADDNICFSNTHIFAKSGKERTAITEYAYDITGTTVTGIIKRASVWSNTADEITKMVITATADKINIGSRIILLKKVHNDAMKTGEITPNKIEGAWERIYSNTLTSTASSVSITSLEGNTDCLYRLIVRGVDSGGVGNWNLRFNSDSGSNYGNQDLKGTSTSVFATRNTGTDLDITESGSGNLCVADVLIYAKSGYERTGLSTDIQRISGTTVTTTKIIGHTWDNTSSEITSMQVIASSNNMAAGTSIELYRLNL